MSLKINFFLALSFSIIIYPLESSAGISVDRTRVIFDGKAKSSSANLTNNSKEYPFLAQSWLENESGTKINFPFTVTPPLQRIDPEQKGVVRIAKVTSVPGLPLDRESLFYLNIKEIPPKPKKENVLQLAMQSKIKLFYRPEQIKPKTGVIWQKDITIQNGDGNISIKNPTPYYVTIASVELGKSSKIDPLKGVMIKPLSSSVVHRGSLFHPGDKLKVTIVNDYGGFVSMNFSCDKNIVCTYINEN